MKKSSFNPIFFTFTISVSCLFSTIFAQSAPDSLLGSTRVVFQTNIGDIEFGFYPNVAPQTVEHIFKLVRLGCYDTNHFFRLHKGLVAQVADVVDGRTAPMNEEQSKEAEKRIKDEFSDIKHVRGVLSMERDPDTDSAQSSFSILLGDAPHLDHKYTIFGKVTKGDETLKKLEEFPTRHEDKFVVPTKVITILSTYYYDTEMETCQQASLQVNRKEAVVMAQEVVKTMLANGYILRKDSLGKGEACDKSCQVSAAAAAKVAELSERIGLTVRSLDKNYQISDTTKSIMSATGQLAVSNFKKGARWMSGALGRAAKATAELANNGGENEV